MNRLTASLIVASLCMGLSIRTATAQTPTFQAGSGTSGCPTCACNTLNGSGASVTGCPGYAGCPPIFIGNANAQSFPGGTFSNDASGGINGFMGFEGSTFFVDAS